MAGVPNPDVLQQITRGMPMAASNEAMPASEHQHDEAMQPTTEKTTNQVFFPVSLASESDDDDPGQRKKEEQGGRDGAIHLILWLCSPPSLRPELGKQHEVL